MKKFLLLFILICCIIFVSAATSQSIRNQISIGEYESFVPQLPKDSLAILSGGKALLPLGNMRGFTPPALTSFICEDDFQYMHIIASQYDSNSGNFTELNYIFSSDTGRTWSSPEIIVSDSNMFRNYSSITINRFEGYPYIAFNKGNASMHGVWFTKDNSPGSNTWSSPHLISDTVNYLAYTPSISADDDGSQVSMLAADGYGIYGLNISSDYGASWNGYSIDANLNANSDIHQINMAKTMWLNGDTIIGLFTARYLEDTIRQDINNVSHAMSVGYSFSYDGGASWDTIRPLYDNDFMPDIPSLNGDTMVYYIDTLDNNTVDSLPVKAFLDTATGLWADEIGNIDTMSLGFGTWWYWWNAEYYDNIVHAAIPYTELYIDYHIENNKLYSFPWQGNAIMYIQIDPSATDSLITYYHIDVHDDSIIDTLGNTLTYMGSPYSCNIAFDEHHVPSIIYLDYLQSNYSSVMRYATGSLPIEDSPIDTLLIDAGLIGIETCKYIVDDKTYFAGIPLTEDSLYYWNGISAYSGISENNKTDKKQEGFSLVRDINNTFSIAYMTETGGHVSADIFDISGRRIINILNEHKNPGTHRDIFSLKNLPAGMYFINIETPEHSSSLKLMHMK